MSIDHFWYSQAAEIRDYEHYALALAFGHLSMWEVPRWNTCEVMLAGAPVVLHYNLCAESENAYERITDKIYLGQGRFVECRAMTHEEVCRRAEEIGMIVPSVLRRSS